MKYEFRKIDEDTTELIYKDKKFEIKKDIELLTTMESLQVRAKRRMIMDLAKDGLTINDLQVERKEGNKTYIDKSSLISLQNDYLDLTSNEMLSEITKRYTNMSLSELLRDIEINISDEGREEQYNFIQDFLKSLRGNNTPR